MCVKLTLSRISSIGWPATFSKDSVMETAGAVIVATVVVVFIAGEPSGPAVIIGVSDATASSWSTGDASGLASSRLRSSPLPNEPIGRTRYC